MAVPPRFPPDTDELFPPIMLRVVDPFQMVKVVPEPTGVLRCYTCRKNFCEHIQSILRANMDADSLWKQIDLDQTLFNIPIRPQVEINCVVRLVRKDGSRDFVKVMSEMTPRDHSTLEPFVGFLNRGEGRIHIRQMIISWFEPEVDVRLHRSVCRGPRHNFSRELRLTAMADANRTDLWSVCWKLVFDGLCGECYDERNAGFDSDLIP